jgi:hypothetical protein
MGEPRVDAELRDALGKAPVAELCEVMFSVGGTATDSAEHSVPGDVGFPLSAVTLDPLVTSHEQDTKVPALGETLLRLASCTLVFCLPLMYNPDRHGIRMAVEPEKFRQTESEIRQNFSGYSRSLINGWYRDPLTGEEFTDDLFRYEIDGSFGTDQLRLLKSWKRELEVRFRQRAIYFRFSAPITYW